MGSYDFYDSVVSLKICPLSHLGSILLSFIVGPVARIFEASTKIPSLKLLEIRLGEFLIIHLGLSICRQTVAFASSFSSLVLLLKLASMYHLQKFCISDQIGYFPASCECRYDH